MVRNNHIISKNHFKKNWKDNVHLKLNEIFRKRRRSTKRLKKALMLAPRPAKGPVRPLVQCPSFRYNTRTRYGRGFTLTELKTVGLNRHFARTIGVSVDHRRRNKSFEVLQRNVQRLKEYMAKLVLYPRNRKKLTELESPVEVYKNCGQLMGPLMPKQKPKKLAKAMTVASIPKFDVFVALRMAKVAAKRKHPKNKAKKTRVTFE